MRSQRSTLPGARPALPRRQAPRAAALVLATAGLLVLAACSSAPKPTPVSGRLEATDRVNPSASDRPSPLMLRVYELRGRASFDEADFMTLFQGDTAALGAELVSKDEVTLSPGESRAWKRTLSPDTRWLAVFGAYRDLEHAHWRAVAPVENGQSRQVTVRADARSVSIDVAR